MAERLKADKIHVQKRHSHSFPGITWLKMAASNKLQQVASSPMNSSDSGSPQDSPAFQRKHVYQAGKVSSKQDSWCVQTLAACKQCLCKSQWSVYKLWQAVFLHLWICYCRTVYVCMYHSSSLLLQDSVRIPPSPPPPASVCIPPASAAQCVYPPC